MAVNFKTLEYQSSVPGADEVFLYWHSSLPYATHQNRWTGGYVPTTYCYYPPNIPANYFKDELLAAPPGRVFYRATPRFLVPFEEGTGVGVPSSPILITPVKQKKYETYRSTIQNLWSQAVKELEVATRIVIIGYSFPETDTRALDLFRSVFVQRGSEIDVEIVAPNVSDIAARIGKDCLDKVRRLKLHDMKFEEYIVVLEAEIPSRLRKAAAEDKDVHDWLERIYVTVRLRGITDALTE